MNCSALHKDLLALERLDPPPADARGHLDECASCREWYRQLTAVEHLAPQTSVPAPQQKAAFIQRFLAMNDQPADILALPFPSAGERSGINPRVVKRERAQRKTALAVALAASLALVALGIWAWQNYEPSPSQENVVGVKPQDTLFDVRVGARPEWKKASTPRERVLVLHGVAGDIEARMETLARNTGTPPELAASENRESKAFAEDVRLCRDVIERIAYEHAPKMPLQEREREFGVIVKRFERVESLASQLANRHANPEAAVALRELAAAAHAGRDELLKML